MVRVPAFWIGLLAIALYTWPAARVARLSPDAVEYVDVARRLLAGEGFRLGIKAYHFGGSEIVHDGLAERAPLYPLIAAVLLGSGFGVTSLQVVNVGLVAAVAMLVYAIGAALFGRRNGTLAALLVLASPVTLLRMVPPMTEALAMTLTLLALWLVIRDGQQPRRLTFLGAGTMLGVGYLTRPTAALVAITCVVGVAVALADRRRAVGPIGALVVGFVALAAPISLYSLATRGSLSYSGQSYLYSVFKDADVIRNGYGRELPTPTEFIIANWSFVVTAVAENALAYARLVFLNGDWLLFLLPAWPLALLALARREYPKMVWPVLLTAVANFLVYAATWSNYQERYQLLTLLLLLPFAVDGLERLGLGRLQLRYAPWLNALSVGVVSIAAIWLMTLIGDYRGQFTYGGEPVRARTDRGLRWTGPARWVEDGDLSRLLEWIDQRTAASDGLALAQPWPLTFFSQRPSTLLPIRLSDDRLRDFVIDYRVSHVVLDTRDRDRRGYQTSLGLLEAEGVRATAVGNYRVFDTRSLWR